MGERWANKNLDKFSTGRLKMQRFQDMKLLGANVDWQPVCPKFSPHIFQGLLLLDKLRTKFGQRHNEVILWTDFGQFLVRDLDLSRFCPCQVCYVAVTGWTFLRHILDTVQNISRFCSILKYCDIQIFIFLDNLDNMWTNMRQINVLRLSKVCPTAG